jgi:hypothetical protein
VIAGCYGGVEWLAGRRAEREADEYEPAAPRPGQPESRAATATAARACKRTATRVPTASSSNCGIMLAADTNFVLHDDPTVLNMAQRIVHHHLGLGNGRTPAKGDVVVLTPAYGYVRGF